MAGQDVRHRHFNRLTNLHRRRDVTAYIEADHQIVRVEIEGWLQVHIETRFDIEQVIGDQNRQQHVDHWPQKAQFVWKEPSLLKEKVTSIQTNTADDPFGWRFKV